MVAPGWKLAHVLAARPAGQAARAVLLLGVALPGRLDLLAIDEDARARRGVACNLGGQREAGAGRDQRRAHADAQRRAIQPLDQPRKRGRVPGDDGDAGQRGDDPAPPGHRITRTVTSSQATTHKVHATTLPVMARVTASASDLRAPPLATTSLARPQA